MAAQTEIFDFRLDINDPAGVIYFEEVASLPSTYLPQTAYFFTTDSRYYVEGVVALLRIPDSKINTWLDNNTDAEALVLAYKFMIAQLGEELRVKKMDNGTEMTEFTSLEALLDYYKDLLKDAEKAAGGSSGPVYVCTTRPDIGV